CRMRIVALLMLLILPAACRAESAFGIWRMNAARSTFTGDIPPKSFTVQIEPHAKGEVFTSERIEKDGRTTTASTILYLDGTPREFGDLKCTGTQSARRVDTRTVEIMRRCAGGEWTRMVRQLSAQPKDLILDVEEQHADGRRFERRLVFEKQ